MKVKDLIEKLQAMPPDADVYHIWDGEPRTAIEVVYLSKSGDVMTVDYGEEVSSVQARPMDADPLEYVYTTEVPEEGFPPSWMHKKMGDWWTDLNIG
jgi:hypothetical protein